MAGLELQQRQSDVGMEGLFVPQAAEILQGHWHGNEAGFELGLEGKVRLDQATYCHPRPNMVARINVREVSIGGDLRAEFSKRCGPPPTHSITGKQSLGY